MNAAGLCSFLLSTLLLVSLFSILSSASNSYAFWTAVNSKTGQSALYNSTLGTNATTSTNFQQALSNLSWANSVASAYCNQSAVLYMGLSDGIYAYNVDTKVLVKVLAVNFGSNSQITIDSDSLYLFWGVKNEVYYSPIHPNCSVTPNFAFIADELKGLTFTGMTFDSMFGGIYYSLIGYCGLPPSPCGIVNRRNAFDGSFLTTILINIFQNIDSICYMSGFKYNELFWVQNNITKPLVGSVDAFTSDTIGRNILDYPGTGTGAITCSGYVKYGQAIFTIDESVQSRYCAVTSLSPIGKSTTSIFCGFNNPNGMTPKAITVVEDRE